MKKIRFIDLFAGIGGTRIGFEEACRELGINTECVMTSEIEKYACETYKLNFNESPLGDIKEIKNIPPFDFLLAGFPCQPFSYAGKRRGFGDTRGTLFFEIEKILSKNKPKAFLLENVRGLTTHDGGKTFQTILHTLNELGYGVTYRLLNSSTFGVPQNRIRVYILGILGAKQEPCLCIKNNKGAADSHKFKLRKNCSLFDDYADNVLVKDILENTVDKKYLVSEQFEKQLKNAIGKDITKLHGIRLIDYRNGSSLHSWQLGIKGKCTKEEINFMNALVKNRRLKMFGTHQDGKKLTLEQIKTFYKNDDINKTIKSLIKKGYLKGEDGRYNPVAGNMSFEIFKFLDPESISITLVTSDAHKLGIVHKGKIRHITPRECARIQGFPDTFKCHPRDTHAYRQFGNSVSVPVIKALIKDLVLSNPPAFK